MVLASPYVLGDTPATDLLQLLPARVGSFQRVSSPRPTGNEGFVDGDAEYARGREKFLVQIGHFQQDSQAYAELTS